MSIMKRFYLAVRYRTWVVYDPIDFFVLYTGKRRHCYQVQKELYAGTLVCPHRFFLAVVESPV